MLRTLRDDRGQGLAEYGLILGFVAVVCIAAITFFGSQLSAQFAEISERYP